MFGWAIGGERSRQNTCASPASRRLELWRRQQNVRGGVLKGGWGGREARSGRASVGSVVVRPAGAKVSGINGAEHSRLRVNSRGVCQRVPPHAQGDTGQAEWGAPTGRAVV